MWRSVLGSVLSSVLGSVQSSVLGSVYRTPVTLRS